MGDTSRRRSPSSLTLDSTVTTWSKKLTLPNAAGTRDGRLTKSPRRRSQVFPSSTASTTSSFPQSVFLMLLSVSLFRTFTTPRELVKLSAELLNKERFDLVTKLVLSHQTSRVRRFSLLNSTRRYLTRLVQVTLSAYPSRVLRRTKRSPLVTLSTTKRMVNSSQSSLSLPWLLSKSTLGSSSPATALSSSLVPQRLRAR